MKNLRAWSILLAGLLYLGPLLAENDVSVTIRLISLEHSSAMFEVRVANSAERSIFLEESLRGSNDLHTIDIELEDQPGKWTRVGPKRDAVGSSVFELLPGKSVSRKISIYELTQDESTFLTESPPRYRVLVRYFRSPEEWTSFSKSLGRGSKPTVVIGKPLGPR
jgi:hypothetical protein